jgi:hypothetical protein
MNNYFSKITETNIHISKKLFYDNNNLKEIEMNSNGLCFLNSIRLYFAQFCDIEYSIQQLHNMIFDYFITNKIQLTNKPTSEHYIYRLEKELDKYFEFKCYNHSIIETLILHSVDIFHIKIIIIHFIDSNIQAINYLEPENDKYPNKFILLSNRPFINSANEECFHFSLIIDQQIQFNYFVDTISNIKLQISTRNNDDSNLVSESDNDSASDSDEDFIRKQICSKVKLLIINKKQSKSVHNSFRIDSKYNSSRHSCGDLNNKCEFCSALFFKDELITSKTITGFCCASGNVKLPEIESPSPIICSLLKGKDSTCIDFQNNIRAYNTCLAFTSLGGLLLNCTTFKKYY